MHVWKSEIRRQGRRKYEESEGEKQDERNARMRREEWQRGNDDKTREQAFRRESKRWFTDRNGKSLKNYENKKRWRERKKQAKLLESNPFVENTEDADSKIRLSLCFSCFMNYKRIAVI